MKKEDLFQTPATIVKLETMSDGGIRIVLDTQEISDPLELTKLFALRKGQLGYFTFKGTEITKDDIENAPVDDLLLEEGETKTPSQRLRSVLFVYWKEIKGGKGDFNAFYRSTIDQLIDRYKEKLPPRSEE